MGCNIETKICTKCHLEKSLSDFCDHSRTKDGKQPWCKLCTCENTKRWLNLNPNYFNDWLKKHPEVNVRNMNTFKRRHPLYVTWKGMLQRCTNPNHIAYYRYGGRGISVCKEWLDLATFELWAINNGWRKALTIDRIDNNGNYESNNCHIITKSENSRKNGKAVNQFDLQGNLIEHFDSVAIACRELGLIGNDVSKACREKRTKVGGFLWSYGSEVTVGHCKFCNSIIHRDNGTGICRECQRHPSRHGDVAQMR